MASNLSGPVFYFKNKIEDAVSLVQSNMSAEEKLQAINWWNKCSEKLQEIVNNSAADINNALELQRENENAIKDVLDSIQNEKELNDNLESLMQQDDEILKNTLTENELIFNNNQVLDSNLNDNLSNNLDNNLNNNLASNLDRNLTNNLTDNLSTNLNLNNLDQADSNQFISTNVDLNLEDITNFTNNLDQLNEQDLIRHNQIKINSTQSTMHKELFTSFDQYQGENVIRNNDKAQSSCDLDLNNRNLLQAIDITNSNDSGFISCNSNGCEDQNIAAHLTNNYLNNQINQITRLNNNQSDNQLTNQLTQINLDNQSDLLLSDNRNNINEIQVTTLSTTDTTSNLTNDSLIFLNENILTTNTSVSKDNDKKKDRSKGNLSVHQRRYSGEKKFNCDKCNSCFSTKGNLKRHIKCHSGERPLWDCSICHSKFTEKKSLKVHFRRHTGEKPYKCTQCSKAFSQTGVLKTHMTLHSDERKFLCTICSKKFRQRAQLRLHQLRHEGIKKWDCSNCSSKFLTKSDLERHSRVHSGERPFRCTITPCSKTFTRQQSLTEHKNRFHFHIKPYNCSYCDKNFVEMSSCYKHIKIHKKQLGDNGNLSLNDNGEHSSDNKSTEQQQSLEFQKATS